MAWTPAPRLSEAALAGTFWQFGALGGMVYGPFTVLAPPGRIGNYRHSNEDVWQSVDDRLVFFTADGATNTIFDQAQVESGQIVALSGKSGCPTSTSRPWTKSGCSSRLTD